MDQPIARVENIIPKRPFKLTKIDKLAKPITGKRQYPKNRERERERERERVREGERERERESRERE